MLLSQLLYTSHWIINAYLVRQTNTYWTSRPCVPFLSAINTAGPSTPMSCINVDLFSRKTIVALAQPPTQADLCWTLCKCRKIEICVNTLAVRDFLLTWVSPRYTQIYLHQLHVLHWHIFYCTFIFTRFLRVPGNWGTQPHTGFKKKHSTLCNVVLRFLLFSPTYIDSFFS